MSGAWHERRVAAAAVVRRGKQSKDGTWCE